jgi:WD40 repeat protein
MAKILLCFVSTCTLLLAGEAAWADRRGQDAGGPWAEIDESGAVLRFRWRTFAHGEHAWLGEAPVPAAVVRACIPDIPDPGSLRWRGEQNIADVHTICTAIESHRPRLRCLLPRLSWLQEAYPTPVPGWPRLWSGDLIQGWVAYQPIGGTRFDDVLASRLWGPPWSPAELIEPPFPPHDPDVDEFSDADRYGFTHDGSDPVAWVRPIDRIGRANDGQTPMAALRRVRKDGEAMAAGEPAGAALGLILAIIDLSGPGEVVRSDAIDAAAPQPLLAPGHRDSWGIAVSVSPDGMWAATANPDGVRLWDLGRGLAIGTLRRADGQAMVDGLMTWSADGQRLFTAGEDGHLACWDAASATLRWRATFDVDDGSWVGNAVGLDQQSTRNVSLSLPGDGRLLRVVQVLGQSGSRSWSLWYDVDTGGEVHPAEAWSVEQGTEAVGEDQHLRCTVKRTADGRSLAAFWGTIPIVADGAGVVAVCDGRSFRRWHLPDLAPLGEIRLQNHQEPRADALLTPLDPEGRSWLFYDGVELASVIDVASGTVRAAGLGACALVRTTAGRFAMHAETAEALEHLVPGIGVDLIGVLPPQRGQGLRLLPGTGPLCLRDGERTLAEVQIRAPTLNGVGFSGRTGLVIADADHGWQVDLATLQTTPTGELPAEPPVQPDSGIAIAGPDGAIWNLGASGAWTLTAADGSVLRQLPPDPLRRTGGAVQRAGATGGGMFIASDGERILCREADGSLRWWTSSGEPPESPVRRLAISPDGRLIASLGETVALWRASDGVLLCRFAQTPGGPIAVTTDGYYAARGDPGPFISFRWAGETWPVTEFDLQRNRPDVVAAAIGLADGPTIAGLNRAWEGRCRRLGVSPLAVGSVTRLPRASIDRTDMPLAIDGSSLDLAVRVDAVPAGSTLVVRLDEVPVPTRSGTPITGPLEHRTLSLVPGMNRIAVSVRLPDGREGLRDSAWVVSRAAAAPPRLHVLAVGCSRYRQPGLDLDFAAKDARDLVAGLQPATAALVVDQDATREGIASAAAQLRQAAPQDVVVVFLAGHGVLDDAGAYWYLTHDADPLRPADRAVSYAAIEDLLEACPSRRRVVLLDTCHAGELDGEGLVAVAVPAGSAAGVRARGLKAWKQGGRRQGFDFLDLRSGVGAAVLASSAGLEFAFESAEWSNGVFTMAVLEGWARGKADGNSDGVVQVGELAAYVAGRVSGLTAGAQNPALRSANRSVDAILVPAR